MADWVAASAAVVAALVAVVALAVALRAKEVAESANKVAKAANILAAAANDTASDALGEAEKANDIAEDSNTIAERALGVALDDVPYNWVLHVGEDGVAVVLNDCGHHARQVTIVLDIGGRVVTEGGPIDVAPFGKIMLDAKSTVEQHFEKVHQNPVVYAHGEGGVFFVGRSGTPVAVTFRAHLRWRTEQEVPRTDVVHEVVRHQMTHDGLKRIPDRRRKGTPED